MFGIDRKLKESRSLPTNGIVDHYIKLGREGRGEEGEGRGGEGRGGEGRGGEGRGGEGRGGEGRGEEEEGRHGGIRQIW